MISSCTVKLKKKKKTYQNHFPTRLRKAIKFNLKFKNHLKKKNVFFSPPMMCADPKSDIFTVFFGFRLCLDDVGLVMWEIDWNSCCMIGFDSDSEKMPSVVQILRVAKLQHNVEVELVLINGEDLDNLVVRIEELEDFRLR